MGLGAGRGNLGGFSNGVSFFMRVLWFDCFDGGKAQLYTGAVTVGVVFVNHTFTKRYVASASRASVHKVLYRLKLNGSNLVAQSLLQNQL